MTMSFEPGIVDANVLAYAANSDDPHHATSHALIAAARDPLTKALCHVSGALRVLFDHHQPASCRGAFFFGRSPGDYLGDAGFAGYLCPSDPGARRARMDGTVAASSRNGRRRF